MVLSRWGIFPLRYMVASKGLLALIGFLCTLVLWRFYRRVLSRSPSVTGIVVISVIASYLMALVWTALDNVSDIPIAGALLDRRVIIRSAFQVFVGSVYNAFTLLAWSLLYFGIKHHDALLSERERSLRAEAMAQRARLEALRYQLHPHFLFNTLNAISTLVVEQRNADASRMLSRLSDFLRLTLASPASDQVSLTEELDFVERYLEIEQVRFGERLSVNVSVDPDAWKARIPCLLLQPVIENAIRHGVATREAGGHIAIDARIAGRMLRLTVSDSGEGPQDPGEPATSGERIGLANVRERLSRLYGASQRVEIVNSPQGTRVLLELPFRTTDA
jgi:LytS/YehU family sensor histidine kinase